MGLKNYHCSKIVFSCKEGRKQEKETGQGRGREKEEGRGKVRGEKRRGKKETLVQPGEEC